jgi:transcriptional regulator with XRE-family HTH domain
MSSEEELLGAAKAARDRLSELQVEADRRREEFHQAVRRLHSAGLSMRDIAEELGLSHQRVHQIVNGGEAMTTPTRGRAFLKRLAPRRRKSCEPGRAPSRLDERYFERFSVDAQEAMSLAQVEARGLAHNYLGTEHLLLGLLGSEQGLAARLLHAVGADLERSRGAVRDMLGTTPVASDDGLAATARLKKVLELARGEAKSLRSTHVRSEHLLLGLAREGRGMGARILHQLGVGYEQLRRRVDRASTICSFCRRDGVEVAHLIAGPGVFICDRCIAEASLGDDRGEAGSDHPPRTDMPEYRTGAKCNFCGKLRVDVKPLVAASSGASICQDCLVLCGAIVEEEREAFVPGRG